MKTSHAKASVMNVTSVRVWCKIHSGKIYARNESIALRIFPSCWYCLMRALERTSEKDNVYENEGGASSVERRGSARAVWICARSRYGDKDAGQGAARANAGLRLERILSRRLRRQFVESIQRQHTASVCSRPRKCRGAARFNQPQHDGLDRRRHCRIQFAALSVLAGRRRRRFRLFRRRSTFREF